MKKKVFIILLFCVILIPKIVLAEDLTCEVENVVHKSDPNIYTVFEKYDDDKVYFYQSERYGLDGTYCRLYCRETIDYEFFDTVYAMAGKSFIYDIKGDNTFITAQFKGRKDCATDIKYEIWENSYRISNEKVIQYWNDLKKWEALTKNNSLSNGEQATVNNIKDPEIVKNNLNGSCSTTESHGKRFYDQTLRKYVYTDIIDCSLSQSGAIYTYTTWQWNKYYYFPFIYTWGDKATGKVSKTGSIHFPLSYGDYEVLGTATASKGKCSCEYVTGYKQEDYQTREWAMQKIVNGYNEALNSYKAALTERENLLIGLADCNLYTASNYNSLELKNEIGGISFDVKTRNDVRREIINEYPKVFPKCSSNTYKIEYGETGKKHDKEYGQSAVISYDVTRDGDTSTTYCNNGNGTIRDDMCSSFSQPNDTRKVDYIECSGTYSNSKCKNVTKEVPVNNYAYFYVKAKMNLYQSQTYNVYAYSGIVSSGVPSNGSTYVALDPYSYPVSLLTPKGSYEVKMTYSCVGDGQIKRPGNLKFENEEYTCNVIVDNETTLLDCEGLCCLSGTCDTGENCKKAENGQCVSKNAGSGFELGFVFRTVNLENIFPSNRIRGKNWKTEFADKVITDSKEKSSTIWNSKPQYSYTLSSINRQNIRAYNKNKETANGSFEGITNNLTFISSGYLSNDLTCEIEGKEFVNCKSEFLKIGETQDFFTGGKVE